MPRQPGFTSSVAAVTILPDADELATAWRKWYIAAAVLRRLRFVRSLIADRRDYNGELNLNLSMEEGNNHACKQYYNESSSDLGENVIISNAEGATISQ